MVAQVLGEIPAELRSCRDSRGGCRHIGIS
jgi:hypothetical protein